MLLHMILSLVLILQGFYCFGVNSDSSEDEVESRESVPCSVCGNSSLPLLYKHSTIYRTGTVTSTMAPWHASIYSKQRRRWSILCGGTLVTSRVVLTAARCLTLNDSNSLMNPQDIRVVLGKTNLWWNVTSQYEIRQQVREIKVHPNYKGSTSKFENDIALIVLKANVSCTKFLAPACVDYELNKLPHYQEDDLGMSTGYGLSREMWEWARVIDVRSALIFTSVNILDYKKCQDIHQTNSNASKALLSTDKFCIVKRPDSPIERVNGGDGVTIYNEGRHFLVGVSSTRLTSSETEPQLNRFGTVSNVTYHMKWIKENLPEVN